MHKTLAEVPARTALQQEFLSHLEAERNSQALQVAELIVRLTEQQFGPNHLELVSPLIDLASVQKSMGDYGASETSYLRAISLVEAKEGFFSKRLVRPLTGLGATYHAAGSYEGAIAAFRRAKHITHRNEGLFNLEQIQLIDALTESYVALERFDDAEREQRYAFRASVRNYGKGGPLLVPAISKLALWYQRTGKFREQRALYQSALSILENKKGKADPALVAPLRGIATTYRLSGFPQAEGEQALKRALAINEQDPDADRLERADLLLDLGDWYITTENTDQALMLYRQAWQLVNPDQQLSDEAGKLFGDPEPILYRPPELEYRDGPLFIPDRQEGPWPPMRRGIRDPLPLTHFRSKGYVDVQLTVRDNGKVEDVEIIDGDLPIALRSSIIDALHHARYRPRFINGEPTATEGVRSRLTYTAGNVSIGPIPEPSPPKR